MGNNDAQAATVVNSGGVINPGGGVISPVGGVISPSGGVPSPVVTSVVTVSQTVSANATTTERGDTGTFKCTECNSIFRRRDHLGRHMMTQHNENCQRTKCPFKDCDTEMVRRDHLRRHISQVHKVDPSDVLPYSRRKPNLNRTSPVDPLKRFKCVFDGCDAELSRKDHLCRHIKNIHKADPRQVIGHMYKQPRPGSGGAGGTTTLGTPTTSLTSSGGGVKTKRKSSKKKAVEDLSTAGANNHASDNHPPPQGSNQPHPSTLSDYDYGADYGGAVSEEESGNDNDDNQLKMEEMRIENEEVVCFLCCYSFYPEASNNSQDFSANVNFKTFFSEVLSNYEHPGRRWGEGGNSGMETSLQHFLSSFTQFPLCFECISLINRALDKKSGVDEEEIKVRQLQLRILRELVSLQKKLTSYWEEMKQIELTVTNADPLCLETFLEKHSDDDGPMSMCSTVLLLRDAVVSASNKLERHHRNLKSKFAIKDSGNKRYPVRTRTNTKILKTATIKEESSNQDETQYQEQVNWMEANQDGDNASLDGEAYWDSFKEVDGGNESDNDREYTMSDNDIDNEDSEEESSENKDVAVCKQTKTFKSAILKTRDKTKKAKKKDATGVKRHTVVELLDTGVDVSGWSRFKVSLLKHTRRLLLRRENVKASTQSQSLDDPDEAFPADPRLEYGLEYNSISKEFTVGSIPVILHEQEKILECSECQHRTNDDPVPTTSTSTSRSGRKRKPKPAAARMQEHIQRKHLSIFQCPLCSSKLGSYRRYAYHVMGHSKRIKCDNCEKAFSCTEYLLNHIWNKHMTEEEIATALSQGQKDRRKKKRELEDGTEPPRDFQCPTCGKGFPTISTLKTHEQVHEENRELICSNCGKVLLGKSSLYHHQRYVCLEKDCPGLPCPECPAILKNKVVLDRHIKYTHGQDAQDRPYRCEVCGAGFAAKNGLQKHRVVHTDERPFCCDKGCGSAFKSKRHLTRHEKICKGTVQPHRNPRSSVPGIGRNMDAAQYAEVDYVDC